MKAYFKDIINILATDRPERYADACALLTPETIKHYPKTLYKYCDFDKKGHNLDSLENDYIYATCPTGFNDPFDAVARHKLKTELPIIEKWVMSHIGEIIYFSIPPKGMAKQKNGITLSRLKEEQRKIVGVDGTVDKKVIRALMSTATATLPHKQRIEIMRKCGFINDQETKDIIENEARKKIEGVVNSAREGRIIASLTKRKNNGMMWENYAGNHSGFVIEYQRPTFGCMTEEQEKMLICLLPVTYYKRKPAVELLPFVQNVIQKELYGKEIDVTRALAKLFSQIVYKDKEYSGEEEWRLVLDKRDNKVSFPFASAVYAGRKISEDNLKRLIEVCKKRKLPLYKQKVNMANPEMVFDEVLEGKSDA